MYFKQVYGRVLRKKRAALSMKNEHVNPTEAFLVEDGDWSQFPFIYLQGRPPVEQLIVAYLIRHRNNVTNACFPSHRTLMKEIGIHSKTTLKRYIKKLITDEIISTYPRSNIDGTRSTNGYKINIRFKQTNKNRSI